MDCVDYWTHSSLRNLFLFWCIAAFATFTMCVHDLLLRSSLIVGAALSPLPVVADRCHLLRWRCSLSMSGRIILQKRRLRNDWDWMCRIYLQATRLQVRGHKNYWTTPPKAGSMIADLGENVLRPTPLEIFAAKCLRRASGLNCMSLKFHARIHAPIK